MNPCRRSTSAVAVLLGLSVLMHGCSSETSHSPTAPATAAGPSAAASLHGNATSAGPLVSVGKDDFSYELPTKKGETVSDGSLVLANTAGVPIRILDVTVDLGTGIQLLGAKVLPLRSVDEDVVGVQRGFPPAKDIVDRWTDAAGAELQPGTAVPAYELVLGLALTSGKHEITKIAVEYEAAGRRHHTDFRHGVTLCVKGTAC
ncbi:MAG TPA: hypothetical protein VFO77_03535 [Actinoplanes sp.]|nr:hypothetical protein [Actinoplanes sp.]